VAVVGDKTITLQELDVQAASALTRVRQEEYDAARQALEAMVNNEVLMKEAAAKKVGKDDLLKDRCHRQGDRPPQAEIDSFYEQHKPQFGTQTKEQLAPQIAAMLKNQKLADAQRDLYEGAAQESTGPRRCSSRPGSRSPWITTPRRARQGPGHDRGVLGLPVPVLQPCRDDGAGGPEEIRDKVRLVYRDYPLQFHPNANIAAQASECAKDQGQVLGDAQRDVRQPGQAHPAGAGRDRRHHRRDRQGQIQDLPGQRKFKDEVQKDFDDGQKYGVTGTPTFFINGIPMVGARDGQFFAEIIDSELERNQ